MQNQTQLTGKTLSIIPAFVFALFLMLSTAMPAFSQESLDHFRDFSVLLEKYPYSKNPYTSIRINMDGNCKFRKVQQGEDMDLEKEKDFKLTAKQLEYIYYQIMRSRFLEMSKVYGNPHTKKGIITRITVKLDYQINTITMYNEKFLAVDYIIDSILEMTPKSVRDDFKSDSSDFSEIKLP